MNRTTRMQCTYGFIVRAMCAGTSYHPGLVTPKQLTVIARDMPQNFPQGLTEEQAKYMLDHPDEVVPDEDIVEDA
jgi:hypothetical protein